MSLNTAHGQLSEAVAFYTLGLGIWGLLNFARRQEVSTGYWTALVIGELLVMTQGMLGGALWAQGHQPAQGIHVLYGAVTALGIPVVYVSTRGREGHTESLAYGGVALLVALLTWQAIATA
jgi:hypothetical protein